MATKKQQELPKAPDSLFIGREEFEVALLERIEIALFLCLFVLFMPV